MSTTDTKTLDKIGDPVDITDGEPRYTTFRDLPLVDYNLHNYRLADLKSISKSIGLRLSGTRKQELISAIHAHSKGDWTTIQKIKEDTKHRNRLRSDRKSLSEVVRKK
jgi:hypothetical protein